jgi:hypothetical protein
MHLQSNTGVISSNITQTTPANKQHQLTRNTSITSKTSNTSDTNSYDEQQHGDRHYDPAPI